jgi:hypothetical protein
MEMWHGANFLSTVTICLLKALMALITWGGLCEVHFMCFAEKYHRKTENLKVAACIPSRIRHNLS